MSISMSVMLLTGARGLPPRLDTCNLFKHRLIGSRSNGSNVWWVTASRPMNLCDPIPNNECGIRRQLGREGGREDVDGESHCYERCWSKAAALPRRAWRRTGFFRI